MLNFLVTNNLTYDSEIPIPPMILPKMKGLRKSNIGMPGAKGSLLYIVGGTIITTTLLKGKQNLKYTYPFTLQFISRNL